MQSQWQVTPATLIYFVARDPHTIEVTRTRPFVDVLNLRCLELTWFASI